MSIFNKQGVEFKHLVEVPKAKGVEPTFSYKFPTLVGATVKERWARKVRPIQSLTRYLQGVNLKTRKDYMVDFNDKTGKYEYWFLDGNNATLFALTVGHMAQQASKKKHAFKICCPSCGYKIARSQIEWDL